MREALKRKSKRTIFTNGGPGSLQMVSEQDTGLCANKQEGDVSIRTLGPKGGGFGRGPKKRVSVKALDPEGEVDCDVPHWLGRRTKHHLQGCGNLPITDIF